jgi:hypothetical protein
MIKRLFVAMLLLVLVVPALASDFDHQHSAFTALLQQHVRQSSDATASTVNYAALKQDSAELKKYLATLSAVQPKDFDSWSADQQLAFLINAYNAYTLALIVEHYPVSSIRKIGRLWENPWKLEFFRLLGKPMHLDRIEHEIIRQPGRFDEPRIHFAVNCASIGCPALAREAYRADTLDSQLEKSTRLFLSDRSRNRYDADRKVLEISNIFDWYGVDFERFGGVAAWLARYAELLTDDPAGQRMIRSGTRIEFLDYDWGLNEHK